MAQSFVQTATAPALETLSRHRCFGGWQGYYRHPSREIGLPMRFGVYLPPQAETERVPVLTYLAGLTCNEETFAIKAGAQRLAAELGIALVTPDTSPRGTDFPARPTAGISASAPASMSMPPSSPGPSIGGCTPTSTTSCPR